MSEKKIAELERRTAQLQTECSVKDIHIGRLAEQLKQKASIVTPKAETDSCGDDIEALKQEKKKLIKMVEKLFRLLHKSEEMRQYSLRLKQVDIIEEELHELLNTRILDRKN